MRRIKGAIIVKPSRIAFTSNAMVQYSVWSSQVRSSFEKSIIHQRFSEYRGLYPSTRFLHKGKFDKVGYIGNTDPPKCAVEVTLRLWRS